MATKAAISAMIAVGGLPLGQKDEVDEFSWLQGDCLMRPVLRVGIFEVLESQVVHCESDAHMRAEPHGWGQ